MSTITQTQKIDEIIKLSDEKIQRLNLIDLDQVTSVECYQWLIEPLELINTIQITYASKVLDKFIEQPSGPILKLVNHLLNESYKKPTTVSLSSDFFSIANNTTDLLVQFIDENNDDLKEVLKTIIHVTSKYLRDTFIETFQQIFSNGITNTTILIEQFFLDNFKNPNVQQFVPTIPRTSLTLAKEYSQIAKTLILQNLTNEFIPMSLIDFYGKHCDEVDTDFIKQINDALFTSPSLEHMELPLIQNDSVRSALMKLLQRIIIRGYKAPELIEECVNKIKTIQVQKVNGASFKKQPFVGLENLGCTCYINSLTQQLYMNPYFRNCIMNAKATENTPYIKTFQKLFTQLHETKVRYISTYDYVSSLKGEDGKPLDPYIQMDTHEFLSSTLDRIENELKSLEGQDNAIENCFAGTLVNQIVSKECEHISEHEEKTICQQMNIVVFGEKNKTSLLESFQCQVQGDELNGDNKYFCEKCQKKVDAVRRTCIKTPPNTLILHIKRFEFDFETLQRIKINDRYEFPRELDLYPFSVDYINNPEKRDETGEYKFKLVGVLIHLGSVDSGHYYSYIKDQETGDEWFSFNDDLIDKFDINTLQDSCFGGGSFSKHYSAYILFYQKEKPTMPIPTVEYPVDLKNEVINDNLRMISNSVILAHPEMSDYLIQQMKYINGEDLEEFKDPIVGPNRMEEINDKEENKGDCNEDHLMEKEREIVKESIVKDLIEICVHYQVTHSQLLYGYQRNELYQNELIKLISKYPSVIDEILTKEITAEKEDDLLKQTKTYVAGVDATLATVNFLSRMFAMGSRDLLMKYAPLLTKLFISIQKTGNTFRLLCIFIRSLCENPLCKDIFSNEMALGSGFICCYSTLRVNNKNIKKVPDYTDLFVLFIGSIIQNIDKMDENTMARLQTIQFKRELLRWIDKCKFCVDVTILQKVLYQLIATLNPDAQAHILCFIEEIEDSKEPLPDALSLTYIELSKNIQFIDERDATQFLDFTIKEAHGYHYPSENICICNIVQNVIHVNPSSKPIARELLLEFINSNIEKEVWRCLLHYISSYQQAINEMYLYILEGQYLYPWMKCLVPKLYSEKDLFSFLYFNKKDQCFRLQYSIFTLRKSIGQFGGNNDQIFQFIAGLYQFLICVPQKPKPDYNLHAVSLIAQEVALVRPDLFDIVTLLKFDYPNYFEMVESKKKINQDILNCRESIVRVVIRHTVEHKKEVFERLMISDSFDNLMNEVLTKSCCDDESSKMLLNSIFSSVAEETLFTFIEHFTLNSTPEPERIQLMISLIFGHEGRIERFVEKRSINKLIVLCTQKVFIPSVLTFLIPKLQVQLESFYVCRETLLKLTLNKENVTIVDMLLKKMIEVLERVEISNPSAPSSLNTFVISVISKVVKSEVYEEFEHNILRLIDTFEAKGGKLQQILVLMLVSTSFIKEVHMKILHLLIVEKKLTAKTETATVIGKVECTKPENQKMKEEIVERINNPN